MKKTLFTLLILFAINQVNAQINFKYKISYDLVDYESMDAKSAVQLPQDSSYVLLSSSYFGTFVVARTSQSGGLLWSKRYAVDSDTETNIDYMVNIGDDVYLSGHTKTPDEKEQPVLIKMDADGEIIWSKIYPIAEEFKMHTEAMTVTADEDLVLVGGGFLNDNDYYSLSFVYKIDKNGNFIWGNALGGRGLYSVENINDAGDLLLGGSVFYFFINGCIVYHLDTDGNVTEERTFISGVENAQRISAIKRIDDNNFILVYNSFESVITNQERDSRILKYNLDAGVEWGQGINISGPPLLISDVQKGIGEFIFPFIQDDIVGILKVFSNGQLALMEKHNNGGKLFNQAPLINTFDNGFLLNTGKTGELYVYKLSEIGSIENFENPTSCSASHPNVTTIDFMPDSNFEFTYPEPLALFPTPEEMTWEFIEEEPGTTDTLCYDNGVFLVLESVTDVIPPSCTGTTDGQATVNITGGILPYTFEWENEETGATAYELATGNVSVTVTDAEGNTITIDVTIPNGSGDVTISGESITSAGQGDVVDLEIAVNLDPMLIESIEWSPSTGLSCSDCLNPTTVYNEDICYTVTIISTQGCMNSAELCLNLSAVESLDNPNIYLSPNLTSGRTILYLPEGKKANISIYNTAGSLMATPKKVHSTNDILDLSNYQAGLYFIRIEINAEVFFRRVIKS